MTDAVRLDDLALPQFSAEGQQILDMMATMAPACPLDADALHEKAGADTGLHDFGPDDYRERLDVYLTALREIDGLHDAGVVRTAIVRRTISRRSSRGDPVSGIAVAAPIGNTASCTRCALLGQRR